MFSAHRAVVLVSVVSLGAAILCLTVSCAGQDSNVAIVPHPDIQARLRRSVEAFRKVEDYRGTDDALRELRALTRLVGKNQVQLVEQWAYFVATAKSDSEATIPLVFLSLLEISDATVVRALAPQLGADDPRIRDVALDQFKRIDARDGPVRDRLNPPNYRAYADYIAGRLTQNEAIPSPFSQYVFRKAPDFALLAFLRAQPKEAQRPLLLSEHVVNDAIWKKQHGFQEEFAKAKPAAINELQELSRHEQWWVRLYVAETLQRHPELRTPELVERLKTDEHALVREAMTRSLREAPKAKGPPNQPPDEVDLDAAVTSPLPQNSGCGGSSPPGGRKGDKSNIGNRMRRGDQSNTLARSATPSCDGVERIRR